MGKDQERALHQESLAAGSLETVTVSAMFSTRGSGKRGESGKIGGLHPGHRERCRSLVASLERSAGPAGHPRRPSAWRNACRTVTFGAAAHRSITFLTLPSIWFTSMTRIPTFAAK